MFEDELDYYDDVYAIDAHALPDRCAFCGVELLDLYEQIMGQCEYCAWIEMKEDSE